MVVKPYCQACQDPGPFCSGCPGVLARVADGRLVKGTHHYVARCACMCYTNDQEAMFALHRAGIADNEDLFLTTGEPGHWRQETQRAWIQTVSGKQFNYLQPSPDSIDILDIAMALSRCPRFAGHTKRGKLSYTVAQHSLFVMDMLEPNLRMVGLLHDAAEAYTLDFPKPLKRLWPEFKIIESRILYAITEALCLDMADFYRPEIKQADQVALATEKRDLMASPCYEVSWEPLPAPLIGVPLQAWSPAKSYKEFIKAYRHLRGAYT